MFKRRREKLNSLLARKKYYHSTPSTHMMHARHQPFSIATNEMPFVLSDDFKSNKEEGGMTKLKSSSRRNSRPIGSDVIEHCSLVSMNIKEAITELCYAVNFSNLIRIRKFRCYDNRQKSLQILSVCVLRNKHPSFCTMRNTPDAMKILLTQLPMTIL